MNQRRGIATTTVIFIAALVGLVAFVGGMRVDEYGLFDSAVESVVGDDNNELPDDLDYSSVEEVYDSLRRNFDGDLTEQEVLDGLKEGLAQAGGDPFTVFLNADQAQQFSNDLNGTFTGIGAEIGLENEVLIVVSPLDGFPADLAGLRPQDAIIRIDNEETFGLSVEDAVLKIRGEAGTDVTLTILRGGEQLDITITRASIVVPSVESEVLEDTIGYLRISRFAEDTSELAAQAARSFVDQGVDSVILDLRNNSGGFLSAAVEVSSLWVDGDVIVEQRENDGSIVTETLNAARGSTLGSLPTVILVNEGSASASEIVAGALQDYDIATLIGQTTFGKGSVQSLERFSDGSELKVTVARWFTPEGRNIDQEGVVPDIVVEFTEEDYENDLDPQQDRAIQELTN